MYGLELMIIIFSTLAQSLSSSSPGMSIVGLIVFWRVLMGVGIGGDYPLSAIITSEFATTRWRGFMMNAVFAMQGFGQLGAGIVLLTVTQGFKNSLELSETVTDCSKNGACVSAVDKMWRIIVGYDFPRWMTPCTTHLKEKPSPRDSAEYISMCKSLTSRIEQIWSGAGVLRALLPPDDSRDASLYIRCRARRPKSCGRCHHVPPGQVGRRGGGRACAGPSQAVGEGGP